MKIFFYEKYIFFAFFILIFFLAFNFFNGNFFAHDTLGVFNAFHYLSEYKRQFNELPFWISDLNSGHAANYLFLDVGLFGIFFSSTLYFLNNDFFIFYCILFFINAIFIYGVYLNFKSSENEKKIFLLIIFFYFSYTSINRQIFWENIFPIFVPYLVYFSEKFLKDFKISNITFLVCVTFLQFILSYLYTIIASIYFVLFYSICFFFYCFINNFKIKIFLTRNNWSSYVYLFFSIIIFFFYAKYILDNIPPPENVAGRNGLNVNFNDFLIWGELGKNNLISSIIIGNYDKNFNGCCFSDYNPNLGPYLLISIVVFLSNLKFFIRHNKFLFLLIFITGLIYFIFSVRLEIKDKFLYTLPYMSMYRHLDYTHILLKVLLLIIMGKIFVKWFNDFKTLNFSLKYFILFKFCISLFLTIIIFKFDGANINIKKIVLIVFLNIFATYGFYKFFRSKKKKYLLLLIIVCFVTFFLNTNQILFLKKTTDEKNFYIKTFNSKINFFKKIDANCLSPDAFLDKYRKAFHYHPYVEVYGLVEVMQDERPCNRKFRWDHGNTKKLDILDLIFHNDLEKISNTKYIIQNISGYNDINIKISFDKNWEIIDDNQSYGINKIVNNNGYIQIKFLKPSIKNNLVIEYKETNFQKNFIVINVLLAAIYFLIMICMCITYVKRQQKTIL